MTPARRKRVLDAHDHVCAYPGCEETKGLEIDHIICLALGGKDEDWNLEPLCYLHHKAKTKLDVKMIARAKRLIRKADPENKKPSQIQSRGFDKTRTKKFNGTVVLRRER